MQKTYQPHNGTKCEICNRSDFDTKMAFQIHRSHHVRKGDAWWVGKNGGELQVSPGYSNKGLSHPLPLPLSNSVTSVGAAGTLVTAKRKTRRKVRKLIRPLEIINQPEIQPQPQSVVRILQTTAIITKLTQLIDATPTDGLAELMVRLNLI